MKKKTQSKKPTHSPTGRRGSRGARSQQPESGAVRVAHRPLGQVTTILIKRAGKEYVHHFTGKHPDVFRVDGRQGVLVIRGTFKLDAQGFIED